MVHTPRVLGTTKKVAILQLWQFQAPILERFVVGQLHLPEMSEPFVGCILLQGSVSSIVGSLLQASQKAAAQTQAKLDYDERMRARSAGQCLDDFFLMIM